MSQELDQQKIYSMIINRNNFYRNNLRFLIVILLLGILSLISLICASIYVSFDEKSAWYIPTNVNGTVITSEDIRTNISNGVTISDSEVIDWVQQIIPYLYNFNFLSSASSFRSMIEYFTPDGYKAYKYALQTQSQTLNTINAAKLVVQGYGCGPGSVEILSSGVRAVQGFPVYTWRLHMPMVARYASSEQESITNYDLTIDVQRVPRLISKTGLAIYSFIVADYSFNNDKEITSLCANLFSNPAISQIKNEL